MKRAEKPPVRADREAELRRGLAAIGSISEETAERMTASMRELRSSWREASGKK